MDNAIKNYAKGAEKARTQTNQSEQAPGRTEQVANSAGGYVFKVSDKDRLERFLILGTDGGTYYADEKSITSANVDFVVDAIKRDTRFVVDVLVDVADKNRAAKNSPSIFVMALVLTHGTDKEYARANFSKVVRTSTHLFEFADYVNALGGWGASKRKAIAGWYTEKDANRLAYQAVKYRQRNGWTHRDLFRKVHPQGVDQRVGNFILGKELSVGDDSILGGFVEMQAAGSVQEVVGVLNRHKDLPWETIPTQFLTDPLVWKSLFYNGALGQTALIRNVTRFQKIGLFDDMVVKGAIAQALADGELIRKGRVHPIQYANALGVYKGGNSRSYGYYPRPDLSNTDAKILGALEAGFYESFATIEPSNKRTSLWIDVSGSMTWDSPAGLVGLNCLEAAAVMAMVTLRTEPYVEVNAFSTQPQGLNLSSADSLDTVLRKMQNVRFGGTDCAVPMLDAIKRKVDVDTFVVYTDSETWAGHVHPFQALQQYRRTAGRSARLAVVGMVASDFTIADPSDSGMMDFVGFDSNAPKVLADFSARRF